MNHYKDFSAADFALDESFQKWVLTPDEQTTRFWKDILKNYPDKKKEIEEAAQLIRFSGLSPDREANEAYLQVWKNLRKNAAATGMTDRTPRKLWQYASLAAAVAGVLLVVTYMMRTSSASSVEYKTDYAELKEVVLEDGSTVILNANSTLRLSDSWISRNEREVFLEGEAYFNVVKTSDYKTFLVKIPGGMEVQVLGTTFNVNTRNESPSVYLESGQVVFHTDDDMVTLQPGDRADYKKTTQKVEVSKESLDDAEVRLAWRNNLYIINDFQLTTIARDIEDNFGKQVIITDSTLATKRVTAKVPSRDIDVLLKVLSETLDIEIEQNANQIIINPRKIAD